MYPIQCVLKPAVVDTGAQRSAAKHSDEILQHTDTSHSMKGTFGQPTTMKGISMGRSTVDIRGAPLTLVIPDESVSDPLLSDSLASAGRLMEAGFEIIFRLPKDALTDGFKPQQYPLYGGTITTPAPSRTIVIEYSNHTWRLPLPHVRSPAEKIFLIDTHNSFAALNNYYSPMQLLDTPDAQSNPSTRYDAGLIFSETALFLQ